MGPFVFVCFVSRDVQRDANTYCMASYSKIAPIDHSSEPAMTDQHQEFYCIALVYMSVNYWGTLV